MEIIAHRINTIEQLEKTSLHCGVEVDLRSCGNDIILHHDPFCEGESFKKWISHYRHGTLILNVKEEGLEERLIGIMKEYNIKNYFFLDLSFPYLVKTMKKGCRNIAVRFSEYESIETVLALKGFVDWVWIDIFTQCPLTRANYQRLKESNFKLCLVSPELVSGNPADIEPLKDFLKGHSFQVDAVCTKYPQRWKEE